MSCIDNLYSLSVLGLEMFSSPWCPTSHHTVLAYSYYLSFISFIYNNIYCRSHCLPKVLWGEDACIQTSILETFLHKFLAKKVSAKALAVNVWVLSPLPPSCSLNSALQFTSASLLCKVKQVNICKKDLITYEFRVKILLFISSFTHYFFRITVKLWPDVLCVYIYIPFFFFKGQ